MQAVILCEGPEIGVRDLELELQSLAPEHTVEMDLSIWKRSVSGKGGVHGWNEAEGSDLAPELEGPEDAWSKLRLALRRRVEDAVAGGSGGPPSPRDLAHRRSRPAGLRGRGGDGGLSWVEIDRLRGPATDFEPLTASYDVTSYSSADTRLRFVSSPTLGRYKAVFFSMAGDTPGGIR